MIKHQALVNGLVHLEIYNKTTIILQNSMPMHSKTDKLLPKHQHFFPHLANLTLAILRQNVVSILNGVLECQV